MLTRHLIANAFSFRFDMNAAQRHTPLTGESNVAKWHHIKVSRVDYSGIAEGAERFIIILIVTLSE